MEDTPAPRRRSEERGVQEESSNSDNTIPFPRPRVKVPGLFRYRQQRSPGDIVAAIMTALDREVRLARDTGVNTPPEVLEGASSWVGRGCLP